MNIHVEEKWIEFVTNKTQILDILNLQFTNFWTDVCGDAMYLYYILNGDPKGSIQRIPVHLGEESASVESIELLPDFRRWMTRAERLGVEIHTQLLLFGQYQHGIQM
jgi:hypothetical protein